MSTITVNLPDELVSKLRATAIRRKVKPDIIVGQALAHRLEIDALETHGSTVAALIGQDFGNTKECRISPQIRVIWMTLVCE